MAKRKSKTPPPRFGIGEWYGRSFVNLTKSERKHFAAQAQNKSTAGAPHCPFLGQSCIKRGGVCSLRLYQLVNPGTGEGKAVAGDEGDLRVTCPHRFKHDAAIYSLIGELMIDTSQPLIVGEVRFLQRLTANEEAVSEGEDVGNIDNVLVHPDLDLMKWCALEIQAVYFSGSEMGKLFRHIQTYAGNGIPFPDATRRPDYRSSGPKRLMPQLQIKVPTLRRWG